MSSIRPSRTAEAITSVFVNSCKPSSSLKALAAVSRELTVTLELPSELAIHAIDIYSDQPSLLVRRKSAILYGCALFSPTVLYFPNRALLSTAVLYYEVAIIPSVLDKPTQCGVWHLE